MVRNIVSFIVVFLVVTTNALKVNRKTRIVTPVGSNPTGSQNSPNYMPWPVPFFTDNQFGYISTISPVTVPPVISSPAAQMPPATIGRVNTIISSPLPIDVSSSPIVTPPVPLVTVINPSMMLNYSANTVRIITSIPKQNRENLGPLVTSIDPKYFVGYSSTQPAVNILPNDISSSDTSNIVNKTSTALIPTSTSAVSTAVTSTTSVPSTISTTSTTQQTLSIPKRNSENLGPVVTSIDPRYFVGYSSTQPAVNILPKNISSSTSNLVNKTSKASIPTSTTGGSTTITSTTSVPSTISLSSAVPITTTSTTQQTLPPLATIINPQYNFNFSSSTSTPKISVPSIPATVSTTASSTSTATPTSVTFRPLGLYCNSSTSLSSIQVSTPGSIFQNNFQVEVPTIVKFDVNISAVPNYIVSIAPITSSDSDVVEINSVTSFKPITASNYINLDISHPNLNTGWSTPAPGLPSTTAVVQKISQEKCMEYSAGRRSVRKSQVQVFIIGGQSSSQKEFPHMAALGYGAKNNNDDNKWLCGGSLISEMFVITAAHCLSAKSLGYVSYVRLGTTTLQTETLNSDDYNVVRRIAHPNYIEGKQYNDVALIELDRPVIFTEYIAPICLYTSTNLVGTNLVATGWGKTSESGDTAKDLQKVSLDYVPNNVCQQAYSIVPKEDLPYGIMESTQVCAGTRDGSRDTCQGDSGGPLQLQQDGKTYLVGITSFGIGCGTPLIPGVYTRVSNYVPWIEQTIWK